jgi:hypothetical protein
MEGAEEKKQDMDHGWVMKEGRDDGDVEMTTRYLPLPPGIDKLRTFQLKIDCDGPPCHRNFMQEEYPTNATSSADLTSETSEDMTCLDAMDQQRTSFNYEVHTDREITDSFTTLIGQLRRAHSKQADCPSLQLSTSYKCLPVSSSSPPPRHRF